VVVVVERFRFLDMQEQMFYFSLVIPLGVVIGFKSIGIAVAR
jgi:hypothetical protein